MIAGLQPHPVESRHQQRYLAQPVGIGEANIAVDQRQRVGIARALILRPKLVVADEPVSALDVSVGAQVLLLLQELQREFGLTYVFISHSLPVVAQIATRIAVMRTGKLVELAASESLLGQPRQQYTRDLLAAVPEIAAR